VDGAAGAVGFLGPVACAAEAPSREAVRDVGSRLELLVDDWLIDSTTNVSLQLNHPPAGGSGVPVRRALGGERRGLHHHLRGRWQVPHVLPRRRGQRCRRRNLLRESPDGIRWTRPRFTPSGDNRLVTASQDAFAPFRDANPARRPMRHTGPSGPWTGRCRPASRTSNGPLSGRRTACAGRRPTPSADVTTRPGAGEVRAVRFPEPRVLGCVPRRVPRLLAGSGREDDARHLHGDVDRLRDVEDLRQPDLSPGHSDEHLYTSAIQPCPHAPHLFVGLPQRFVPESWMTYAGPRPQQDPARRRGLHEQPRRAPLGNAGRRPSSGRASRRNAGTTPAT